MMKERNNDLTELRQKVINYTSLVRMIRYNTINCNYAQIRHNIDYLSRMKVKLKRYADKLHAILYPYTVRDLL